MAVKLVCVSDYYVIGRIRIYSHQC